MVDRMGMITVSEARPEPDRSWIAAARKTGDFTWQLR
jgi:hypothetical protein